MQRDVLLSTYLNDHVAAAEGGLRLARNCLAQNRGEALARVLPGIIEDLEEEHALLQDLAGRLPGQAGPLQRALAWLSARASPLKFQRWLFEYTPLSRLEELEALATGIQARRHHEQVEHHRREAARAAFTEPPATEQTQA